MDYPKAAPQGRGGDRRGGNGFLDHLRVRGFSPATVRKYAFDLVNFARFLEDAALGLGDVAPTDLFAHLNWQTRSRRSGTVVAISRGTPAPATLNRRIPSGDVKVNDRYPLPGPLGGHRPGAIAPAGKEHKV